MNNKILGNKGEQAAVQYLENHGYLIRERNYRARTGEIDIIASKGDTISFVEVKTRGSVEILAPKSGSMSFRLIENAFEAV